ncbi:hypothetical protein SK128_007816 [Halocaridina rubra]|uniref:Uncharacterized protein n=1 Tax=Halocaridina rubra TaxID=373956 RepID=A0AAN8WBH7_HALRR
MLVTITYRSSLIAHLTVPGKPPELNSLQELVEENRKVRWTWGYEPTYGSGWEWLKINENSVVKEVFQSIQVLEIDEQVRRVLRGRHAFITWKYYIKNIIASKYTDQTGYTPIYTGKQEFFNYGGYGWGYRKGAPFRKRFDVMKLRLIESGAIHFWLNELIETSAAKSRIEKRLKKQEQEQQPDDDEEENSIVKVDLVLDYE